MDDVILILIVVALSSPLNFKRRGQFKTPPLFSVIQQVTQSLYTFFGTIFARRNFFQKNHTQAETLVIQIFPRIV